jgi:hypothetical protein
MGHYLPALIEEENKRHEEALVLLSRKVLPGPLLPQIPVTLPEELEDE